MEPCNVKFVGRLVSDYCEECHHMLLGHKEDRVCSVCEMVNQLVPPMSSIDLS